MQSLFGRVIYQPPLRNLVNPLLGLAKGYLLGNFWEIVLKAQPVKMCF